MKKLKLIFSAATLAFLFTSCGSGQAPESKETGKADSTVTTIPAESTDKVAYECPMRCEGAKTYDSSGTCPVCGMDLERIVIRGNDTIRTAE